MIPVEDHAPAWLRALHAGDAAGADPVAAANVGGMLAGWRDWPEHMDFLAPAAPNHAWKALSTGLYAAQLAALLPEGLGGRALDLACGIGRSARPLLARGATVHGVDATLPSLRAAAGHLAPHADRARLLWGDVADPVCLGALAPPYDGALALELLCYLPRPDEALARWLPLLRPGAPLALSVEAWPGALVADPSGLDAAALPAVLSTRTLVESGVRHVRAYARDELVDLLRTAGLVDVRIVGTHHLLDGPLAALAAAEGLDPPSAEALLGAELALAADPSAVPRAWLAVARAPGGDPGTARLS